MPYKNNKKQKEYFKRYDKWRYENLPERKEQLKKSELKFRTTEKYKIYHKKYDQYSSTNRRKYGSYSECKKIIDEIFREIRKIIPDAEDRRNMRTDNRLLKKMKIAWKRHLLYGYKYNY